MTTRPAVPAHTPAAPAALNVRGRTVQRTAVGPDHLIERLDRVTAGLARHRHVAHVAVGVADRAGTLHYQAASGQGPDGSPLSPAAPHFLASITKLTIATGILRAHEEGLFDIEDPIVALLPDGLLDGLHVLDGVDHTPTITVRHLLTHTSGLPDYLEDAMPGERSWYDQMAAGVDRDWDLETAIARARELGPRFVPGSRGRRGPRARYSDTGYQLLLAVLATVHELPVPDVLPRTVLEPLGMDRTHMTGHAPTAEVAAPLRSRRHAELSIDKALAACNDLTGPMDELLGYTRAWADGADLHDPATAQLRWREPLRRIHYPIDYGLGLMRFEIPRLFGPGRRPATLIGHTGSTGTWAFHCPEVDLVAVGAVNLLEGRRLPFRAAPRLLAAATASRA